MTKELSSSLFNFGLLCVTLLIIPFLWEQKIKSSCGSALGSQSLFRLQRLRVGEYSTEQQPCFSVHSLVHSCMVALDRRPPNWPQPGVSPIISSQPAGQPMGTIKHYPIKILSSVLPLNKLKFNCAQLSSNFSFILSLS